MVQKGEKRTWRACLFSTVVSSVVVLGGWWWHEWKAEGVLQVGHMTAKIDAGRVDGKADDGEKDGAAALDSTHAADAKLPAVLDPLDVVLGDSRCASCRDKCAVHGMGDKVGADGLLGGVEALAEGDAAEDAAAALEWPVLVHKDVRVTVGTIGDGPDLEEGLDGGGEIHVADRERRDKTKTQKTGIEKKAKDKSTKIITKVNQYT